MFPDVRDTIAFRSQTVISMKADIQNQTKIFNFCLLTAFHKKRRVFSNSDFIMIQCVFTVCRASYVLYMNLCKCASVYLLNNRVFLSLYFVRSFKHILANLYLHMLFLSAPLYKHDW